jgi:hypothetical protein
MYNKVILHTFTELISEMKSTNLGEFEELVLTTVATLMEEAYSVAICEAIETRGGKRKRFYQLTVPEKTALVCTQSIRDQLWGRIPLLAWKKC